MPNVVQINSLSGNTPFDVYVCDQTITHCFFVTTISGATYTFNVPSPLQNSDNIVLKIIDSQGCEKILPLSCQTIYGKEFENFDIFLFQDADIYLFEGP